MRPISGWTSFTLAGLLISMIVAHLFGFTSIPRSVSKNPRNFPACTINTHFSRFSFKSSTYTCIPNHWGENSIHQPLVGGTSILKAKGHDLVAITGEFGHEGGLALIPGLHTDLIVSRDKIVFFYIHYLMLEIYSNN